MFDGWQESKERELVEEVEAALFKLQEHCRKTEIIEWRQVYSIRCDVGGIENQLRYQIKKRYEEKRDAENAAEEAEEASFDE